MVSGMEAMERRKSDRTCGPIDRRFVLPGRNVEVHTSRDVVCGRVGK